MAFLQHDEASGRYRIRFDFGGQECKRSIKTKDRKIARGIQGRVEETIRVFASSAQLMKPSPRTRRRYAVPERTWRPVKTNWFPARLEGVVSGRVSIGVASDAGAAVTSAGERALSDPR